MQGGKLDRLVTLQSLTPTTNITGEYVNGWTDFATVWGSKQETPLVKSTEGFQAAQLTESLATVWQIRYRAGVNTRMRLVSEGLTYEIINIGEIPRRRGWTITSVKRESDNDAGSVPVDPTDPMCVITTLDIKTADYTALVTDAYKVIPFDCTQEELTCTLPPAIQTSGKVFRPVKLNVTGEGLNVVVSGGGIINLGEGLFINNQQDAVPLLSDGSKYITFGG
jgi:SPP1 family predicted phage head-tail adaptor